ncbi:MAG: ABC transporter substrate-binding protein [Acidobacteria bacterium]|nr:ABC transporter substrate-binding protein [Acidobacteriota bacterium]
MTRTITLAHSPDADDAFMFYALAKDKIDTGGMKFVHTLMDIQSLNVDALNEKYDVTAISFGMYPRIADKYALLSSGSSIGDGYGPVVVSKEPLDPTKLAETLVAVPGENTSAYVSLKLYCPKLNYVVMDFMEIQEAVIAGKVPAGLLIHEGQLTYEEEGLKKVVDLGAWWKEKTALPLPMGGNAIRRSLGSELMMQISQILRASIRYSLEHRDAALDYAMTFGRGLPKEKADRFVGMWVNELTVDYGDYGRSAVRAFLTAAHDAGLLPKVESLEFY